MTCTIVATCGAFGKSGGLGAPVLQAGRFEADLLADGVDDALQAQLRTAARRKVEEAFDVARAAERLLAPY